MTSAEQLLYIVCLGGAVPDVTPERWSAWAASTYATTIRAQIRPPWARALSVNDKGEVYDHLDGPWRRVTALRRKETALLLAHLALERAIGPDGVIDTSSPWHGLAERWVETYRRLPGGDPPVTPRQERRMAELRTFAEAACVR